MKKIFLIVLSCQFTKSGRKSNIFFNSVRKDDECKKKHVKKKQVLNLEPANNIYSWTFD